MSPTKEDAPDAIDHQVKNEGKGRNANAYEKNQGATPVKYRHPS
jgi:hypothetical protein